TRPLGACQESESDSARKKFALTGEAASVFRQSRNALLISATLGDYSRLRFASVIIPPAKRIRGRLTVPGDNSLSHRAAMIAAMANGTSHLSNYSTSADWASTLACLTQLGVQINRHGADVTILGVGTSGLHASNGPLDCGNSGTTMRLLAGVLAGQDLKTTLTGDESLSKRPM